MTTIALIVVLTLALVVAAGSTLAIVNMTRQGVPRRSLATWLIAARHGLVDVVGEPAPAPASAAEPSSRRAASARGELVSH